MPRKTDELISEGFIGDKPDDYEGVRLPPGIDAAAVGRDYYAYQRTYRDGTKEIQWFKRGPGAGVLGRVTGAAPPPDEVVTTSEQVIPSIEEKWNKAQADATKPDPTVTIGSVPSSVIGKDANGRDIYAPVQTTTGPATAAATGTKEWRTEGTPDGQGGFDNSRPVMAAYVNGKRTGETRQPEAKELEDWNLAGQMTRNPGGQTDAQIAAAAAKPPPQDKALPGVTQTTDKDGRTVKTTIYQRPDGSKYSVEDIVQAAPKPATPPTNVSAPANQRTIEERVDNGDGTYTITPRKNPNWKPESKVVKDESSGKWIQITETDEGGYTIKPVDDQTTIKPADLPVLQAKYGEISQGLGALAADLNGRYARGEITEKQRNDAFAAGHQQASTQITEINSILSNSQSAWRQEIEQRGQTLSDTASRRTFAGNVLGQAVGTGQALAISSGPGHGAAIAGGVGALLNIGQRYAEGMGGFRESPEIAMPAAVRQARDVNLPGFGPGANGPQPAAGGSPSVQSGITSGSPPPATPPSPLSTGVSQTTDAGGVPRVMTPSSPAAPAPTGGVDPGFWRGPGGGGESVDPGFWRGTAGGGENVDPGFFRQGAAPGVNPLVAQMAQQLQGASGFAGSPAAAGGAGVFDPLAEGERMLTSRAPGDTDWEEAVRRAAQAVGQPSQPGYQRFYS